MVYGCGVDLIVIDRVQRTLNRFGNRFLNKVFTPTEKEYCLARNSPAQSLAARFAAKEAVAKSLGLGLGQFSWQEIEVIKSADGRPEINLWGRALAKARVLKVRQILISLSHTDVHAIAQAIATY